LTTITRHFTLKFRFSSVVYNQLLTDKSDPADKLGNDYPNNVRHKQTRVRHNKNEKPKPI